MGTIADIWNLIMQGVKPQQAAYAVIIRSILKKLNSDQKSELIRKLDTVLVDLGHGNVTKATVFLTEIRDMLV